MSRPSVIVAACARAVDVVVGSRCSPGSRATGSRHPANRHQLTAKRQIRSWSPLESFPQQCCYEYHKRTKEVYHKVGQLFAICSTELARCLCACSMPSQCVNLTPRSNCFDASPLVSEVKLETLRVCPLGSCSRHSHSN